MLSPSLGREEHIGDYSKSNICRRSKLPHLLYSLFPTLGLRFVSMMMFMVKGRTADAHALLVSGTLSGQGFCALARPLANQHSTTMPRVAGCCEPLMAGYIDHDEAETFLAPLPLFGARFSIPTQETGTKGCGIHGILIVWGPLWASTLGFSLGSDGTPESCQPALLSPVPQGTSKPLQLPGLNDE